MFGATGFGILVWFFGVQGLGAEVVTVWMAELSSLRIQTVGIMQVGIWDLEFVFMDFLIGNLQAWTAGSRR